LTVPVQPTTAGSWTVPVVRGALALIATAVITFTQDHSPQFGLLVFGCFAIVSGAVLALPGRGAPLPDRVSAVLGTVQALAGLVAGAVALLALIAGQAGLGFYLFLVIVWAAVTGMLELYRGIRARGRAGASRDLMTVGVLTAVLAVVYLLLPPHAVVAVGLLGAYLALTGVYLIIGGLSLKWGQAGPATPEDPETLP